MFVAGDIVAVYSPIAGKRKYHLCLQPAGIDNFYHFSFLNSGTTFNDFSVECDEVPCLPRSATGKTVFSFTLIVRFSLEKLALFEARKMGSLDPALALKLVSYVETAKFLTRPEKVLICDGLRHYIAANPTS